ncbi:MAG: hypothetical protein MSD82_10775, partial [Prevotella sp.]|nr:hypothetical protein [Prevotella sp.]
MTLTIGERVIDLQAVVVKGKAPAVIMKGDTIQFNPAGVKVFEDDMVRQILEQMPGVKIGENSISVLDKEVRKTYVDGRTLFGDNPMTAVDHVQGTDVVNIKAYEEDEHKNQKRKNRRGRKQMVLNIETKSKMINSMDACLLAGIGVNTERHRYADHRTRYAVGGTFNFFSDQLLLSVDAMHNNLAMPNNTPMAFTTAPLRQSPSPVYGEASLGKFVVERNWNKQGGFINKISSYYQFTRKTTDLNRESQTDYFATSSFHERTYSTLNHQTNQENKHRTGIAYAMDDEKLGRMNVSYDFESSHNRNGGDQQASDKIDATAVKTDLLTRKLGITRANKVGFDYDLPVSDWEFGLHSNFSHSSSTGTEFTDNRRDNTQLSLLRMPTDNKGTNVGATASAKRMLAEDHPLWVQASYSFNAVNDRA